MALSFAQALLLVGLCRSLIAARIREAPKLGSAVSKLARLSILAAPLARELKAKLGCHQIRLLLQFRDGVGKLAVGAKRTSLCLPVLAHPRSLEDLARVLLWRRHGVVSSETWWR